MPETPVPETMEIQSHKGPYRVTFTDRLIAEADGLATPGVHALVDANIARLYAEPLRAILSLPTTIVIEATEENKSLQQVMPVMEQLVRNQLRRDQTLLAIGGGVIQDITCFIASTMLRGVPWTFIPTTLLAQADSCIGSKSSINLGTAKNILGTFNPPAEIMVDAGFLDTLDTTEIHSGIGEIIKVHAIDGRASFDRLASRSSRLATDRAVLAEFIAASLQIKKRFIEVDEFDRGVRNVFNYGHSFGHAIEAATRFGIPHGIAVTMGMAMANDIAAARGVTTPDNAARMRGVLRENYAAFADYPIPAEPLRAALLKDKKNTATELVLILPTGEEAAIERVRVAPDATFVAQCDAALERLAA